MKLNELPLRELENIKLENPDIDSIVTQLLRLCMEYIETNNLDDSYKEKFSAEKIIHHYYVTITWCMSYALECLDFDKVQSIMSQIVSILDNPKYSDYFSLQLKD